MQGARIVRPPYADIDHPIWSNEPNLQCKDNNFARQIAAKLSKTQKPQLR